MHLGRERDPAAHFQHDAPPVVVDGESHINPRRYRHRSKRALVDVFVLDFAQPAEATTDTAFARSAPDRLDLGAVARAQRAEVRAPIPRALERVVAQSAVPHRLRACVVRSLPRSAQ